MGTSFVPGPWLRAGPLLAGEVDTIGTAEGSLATVHYAGSLDTSIANAALISAAPDLYSVVEAVVAAWGSLETSSLHLWEANLLFVARAALAKARGEE